MLTALLHGIALAFGLILPLGAQNVFVFNQGASQPKFRGAVPVIITASLCDTLLILLAVFGVSVIVFTVPLLQTVLFSLGLLFLIYMGWSIWNSAPASLSMKEVALTPKKQIMFALSVSLLNPHAILDTVGVIGTSSLSYNGLDKVVFTIATISVSWIWFLCLAIAGRIVGNFDTKGTLLKMINKLSALIIWGVALYIAVQLYKML
ncbi:L-lysine exporter family protein LysE/ArgO [Anoxybacillus tepidamans]|uniref:L-lysine exporter family protein LysE/ArgO n=1 Tax=Anoxybacteroides tepidamans TaxID=265948 RepID=A0A7W8MTS5_9BACL|nr:LysE/ArgO family amino acid transporter [Anoxybacillus tepidamans]MBB5323742.1 L-lysine exporter family protein LysE/ArgO [Anoxybacillus tepidamans]